VYLGTKGNAASGSSNAPHMTEEGEYDYLLDSEPKNLKEAFQLLQRTKNAIVETIEDSSYWYQQYANERKKRILIQKEQAANAISGAVAVLAPRMGGVPVPSGISEAVAVLAPRMGGVPVIPTEQPPPPVDPPPPPPVDDDVPVVAVAVLMAGAITASVNEDDDQHTRKRKQTTIFAPCHSPAARDWKTDDKKDDDGGSSSGVLFPPLAKSPAGSRKAGRPPGAKNRL